MIELPEPDMILFDANLQSPLEAYSPALVRRLIAEAVAKEREACATWIETQRNETPACGFEFAAAIRARTKEPRND